ncbi:MAG: nitrophenyl compound nitroreductase subunit ArsF family protein [Pseudomonadota bacterium]
MSRKDIVFQTTVLLVLGIAFFLVGQRPKRTELPQTAAQSNAPKIPVQAHFVRVYYFHGSLRCVTCHKLENLAREAIQENFGKEMKNGNLVWQAINVEDGGNEHFVKDYQLFTKSLVVADVDNGTQKRWKSLAKIWELVRDENAYKQYVVAEVRQYLEGPS